ncbi:hypothetical protein ACFLZB_04125 [Nanoarchaeota archaeon]
MKKEMYSSPEACRTLNENYMTENLKQAQERELSEVRKIILGKNSLDVFDIGVGDARLPLALAQDGGVWNHISSYEGIEISDDCIIGAEARMGNISDKIRIKKFDARDLSQLVGEGQQFGLVLCTYFTAGNFYPRSYSFGKGETVTDSEIKSEFQKIFFPAFDLLRQGGELVLGSVYIDNEATKEKQREFYEKCGMTVISSDSPFMATKEGFWSLRFTKERVHDFLDFVSPENIQFVPLDNHDFAMMVRVSKQ